MLSLNIKNVGKYFMEKKPKPVGPNTVYIHNMCGLLYIVKSGSS